MAKYLALSCGILIYFVSSLGGVAIVKFLNYHNCFESWSAFALFSRSTWLLSVPLHWLLQWKEGMYVGGSCCSLSKVQFRIYVLISIGLSLVELVNSLSMTALPGSWYALLKGSDVGWSMLLSRLILKKTYCPSQVISSCLIMGGIGIVFVFGAPSNKTKADSSPSLDNSGTFDDDDDDTDMISVSLKNQTSLTFAACLCLFGAFLNALCAVWTEATLKATLAEEEERLMRVHMSTLPSAQEKDDDNSEPLPTTRKTPSKLLVSNAYSMWTTYLCFCILILPASLTGQIQHLSLDVVDLCGVESQSDNIDQQKEDHSTFSNISTSISAPVLVIIMWLSLIGVSRFFERLSKYWICVCESAMTFSLIQAARRLLAVFVLAWLFGESFPLSMWAGASCSATGFLLNYWSATKGDLGGNMQNHIDNHSCEGQKQQYELVPTSSATE